MADVTSITKNLNPYTPEEIGKQAERLMAQAQIYFTIGATLFGFIEMMRRKELSVRDLTTLKATMKYVEGLKETAAPKGDPPVTHAFDPGGRVFRKTAQQLAHEFQARLQEIGLFATIPEIEGIIRGEATLGVVTTVIENWTADERQRGVQIV